MWVPRTPLCLGQPNAIRKVSSSVNSIWRRTSPRTCPTFALNHYRPFDINQFSKTALLTMRWNRQGPRDSRKANVNQCIASFSCTSGHEQAVKHAARGGGIYYDFAVFSNLLSNTPTDVRSASASSNFASPHAAHRTFRCSSSKYTYPMCLFTIPNLSRTYSMFWLETIYVGCKLAGTVRRKDDKNMETSNDLRTFSCRLI